MYWWQQNNVQAAKNSAIDAVQCVFYWAMGSWDVRAEYWMGCVIAARQSKLLIAEGSEQMEKYTKMYHVCCTHSSIRACYTYTICLVESRNSMLCNYVYYLTTNRLQLECKSTAAAAAGCCTEPFAGRPDTRWPETDGTVTLSKTCSRHENE